MNNILSVVIPVYNEERFIEETLKEVISAESGHFKKEIIVVDDCSTDKTVKHIQSFISKFNKKTSSILIKLISKKINEGKGAAVKDGFAHTTGDVVIVQDADLEYSPHEYSLLLEPFVTSDADVVYGSRFISDRPHRVLYFWHSVANHFLTFLSNILTNLNLTDMETGYKVFRGDLIRKLAPKLQSKRFGFEPEITALISRVTRLKIYEVGISYWGRTYAEGKKISWVDGVRALFEILRYNLFR